MKLWDGSWVKKYNSMEHKEESLFIKSIPYFDLDPFLKPKGPGINKVKGFVPGFKSTL